jgi:hypothetical protein
LEKVKRIATLLIFLSILWITGIAHAAPGSGPDGHVTDGEGVLLDGESNRASKTLLKYFSSVLIDDAGNNRFLTSLPFAPDGSKLAHRDLFHWGFSDNIPFNRPGRLHDYIMKFPPNEREVVKKRIVEEWEKRVSDATRLVADTLRISDLRKAKAVAGLIYDTHLLGDYKPLKNTNKDIASLQDINKLCNDIKKNIHRLMGNNSSLANSIVRRIDSIPNNIKKDPSLYAEAILNILKEEKIGEKLYSMGIISKPNAAVVEATIKSLSNPTVLSVIKKANDIYKGYSKLINKIPKRLHSGINTGVLAGLASGISHSWFLLKGDEDLQVAFCAVAEDTVLSGASVSIAEGVIYNIGNGRYALVALAKEKTFNLLEQSIGAGLNYGLGAFIFDESRQFYLLGKGEITPAEFYSATSESVLKSAASGSASFCTVILTGLGASNPVVVAVGIGGFMVADFALGKYKDAKAKQYLFIQDLNGFVPPSIIKRITPFNLEEKRIRTPFNTEEWNDNTPFNIDRWDVQTPYSRD